MNLIERAIRIEIPGFRPLSLITNILDETITARGLALHYHKRWDIEEDTLVNLTQLLTTLTGS